MNAQFPSHRFATLRGHNGPVHAVQYSSGLAQYILTGCSDRLIRLYNPSRAAAGSSSGTSGLIQTYQAHGYEVLDLAVAEDNARFVSVGGDKTVFLWDVQTANTLRRFNGHAGKVECCAFAGEDDSVVVSGSFDSTVRLWDTKSHSTKPLLTLSEARDSVSSLSVSGPAITAGSIDGRLRTYDMRTGRVTVDVIAHPVTALAATRAGDALLATCLDSTLRLMDRADGRLLQAFRAPGIFVNETYRVRCALGMGDSVVICGSETGEVIVWDLLDGKVKHRLWHSEEFAGRSGDEKMKKKTVISAVAFCGSRKEWCSAGGNGEVAVFGLKE